MALPKALMKRLFLSAFVVLLLGAAPSFAGPSEDAEAAYKRGDFASAFRLWKPLAEKGNAEAGHCQSKFG